MLDATRERTTGRCRSPKALCADSIFAKDCDHVFYGDDKQPVVPFEVHWDPILRVEEHPVVLPDRVIVIVLDLGTDCDHPPSQGGYFNFVRELDAAFGLLAVFVLPNQHAGTNWFHGFDLGCLGSISHIPILGRLAVFRP